MGIVTMLALGLIFHVEVKYKLGIILGVAASLTASIFGTINGVLVQKGTNTHQLSLYELLGAFLGLSIYIIGTGKLSVSWLSISSHDWFYLLILGIVCTSLPYLVSMYILKELSPFTLALTLNLETIYGILFAFFIYKEHEQMTPTFFIATLILLSAIFANTIIKNYHRRKLKAQ